MVIHRLLIDTFLLLLLFFFTSNYIVFVQSECTPGVYQTKNGKLEVLYGFKDNTESNPDWSRCPIVTPSTSSSSSSLSSSHVELEHQHHHHLHKKKHKHKHLVVRCGEDERSERKILWGYHGNNKLPLHYVGPASSLLEVEGKHEHRLPSCRFIQMGENQIGEDGGSSRVTNSKAGHAVASNIELSGGGCSVYKLCPAREFCNFKEGVSGKCEQCSASLLDSAYYGGLTAKGAEDAKKCIPYINPENSNPGGGETIESILRDKKQTHYYVDLYDYQVSYLPYFSSCDWTPGELFLSVKPDETIRGIVEEDGNNGKWLRVIQPDTIKKLYLPFDRESLQEIAAASSVLELPESLSKEVLKRGDEVVLRNNYNAAAQRRESDYELPKDARNMRMTVINDIIDPNSDSSLLEVEFSSPNEYDSATIRKNLPSSLFVKAYPYRDFDNRISTNSAYHQSESPEEAHYNRLVQLRSEIGSDGEMEEFNKGGTSSSLLELEQHEKHQHGSSSSSNNGLLKVLLRNVQVPDQFMDSYNQAKSYPNNLFIERNKASESSCESDPGCIVKIIIRNHEHEFEGEGLENDDDHHIHTQVLRMPRSSIVPWNLPEEYVSDNWFNQVPSSLLETGSGGVESETQVFGTIRDVLLPNKYEMKLLSSGARSKSVMELTRVVADDGNDKVRVKLPDSSFIDLDKNYLIPLYMKSRQKTEEDDNDSENNDDQDEPSSLLQLHETLQMRTTASFKVLKEMCYFTKIRSYDAGKTWDQLKQENFHKNCLKQPQAFVVPGDIVEAQPGDDEIVKGTITKVNNPNEDEYDLEVTNEMSRYIRTESNSGAAYKIGIKIIGEREGNHHHHLRVTHVTNPNPGFPIKKGMELVNGKALELGKLQKNGHHHDHHQKSISGMFRFRNTQAESDSERTPNGVPKCMEITYPIGTQRRFLPGEILRPRSKANCPLLWLSILRFSEGLQFGETAEGFRLLFSYYTFGLFAL